MSMKDYGFYDYGMILDEETIKLIAAKVFDNIEYDDVCDLGYKLNEEGICEYVGSFTGETQELTDDGAPTWCGDTKEYDDDILFYLPLSNYPTLFKKAYNNMDEIINEFKEDVGEYLPDDFDYRSRIRHICGTYYG